MSQIKQSHFYFHANFSKCGPNFNNSYTFGINDKVQEKLKQMLPPHLISVASLPREIWMLNFDPSQQLLSVLPCPLLFIALDRV